MTLNFTYGLLLQLIIIIKQLLHIPLYNSKEWIGNKINTLLCIEPDIDAFTSRNKFG